MSASQVGGVDSLGAIGLARRIKAKDDLYDFLPIGAFGLRIKEAKIGHEMSAVIRSQLVATRRFILKILAHHIDLQ